MKRLNRIFVIAIVASFVLSCSGSDEASVDTSSNATAIIDSWEYIELIAERPIDVNGDGEKNTDLLNSQEIRECLKGQCVYIL